MTIDERLEELGKRTGEIAKSLELLTGLCVDSERRHGDRFAKTEARMAQLTDTMNRLAALEIRRQEVLLQDFEDPPF